ncbi:ABC transporter ATP-binding protein [Brevibacterium daeguense]|uniref:ABC transporter ATP-binding protein n=1 Tax=Brevibacterium daeguense TaxID=909936 RepID=A0ABP8ENH8_9MICO|nr:ABC transporter ATP-binding protein [Brevibacterium daeguense]
MQAPPLEISELGYSYGRHEAIRDVSLSARPGTVHAVLGPNGAGKSTTIACAVGLLRPDRGTVRIFGADPVSDHTCTAGVTGVMLQDGGLPMASRPLQALEHLARMYRDPLPVGEIAERLGITGFSRRTIRRLSGGQRQRVGLAAALIGRPRLVFLDEPTAGLDPQASLVVREVIGELRADGVAVVLTTHDIDDAQQLADHVTIIDHGVVIAAGTPAGLMDAEEGSQTLCLRSCRTPSPELLRRLARFGAVSISGEETTIIGNFGPRELAAVTAALAEHDASVLEFALHGRTLNDVFLDLTGRELR